LLVRRNLRKKEEEIAHLQKAIDRLEDSLEGMQAYDYADDAVSVKSRLVKPLRGGLFQR
jgi:division protein CdvB (Snf7/Vps24/ESCRT-III family)